VLLFVLARLRVFMTEDEMKLDKWHSGSQISHVGNRGGNQPLCQDK